METAPRLRAAVLIVFAALAAAGVILPASMALFGSQNMLLHAAKDDGFYYLKLAENLARGRGATFDGLGPTNGFHPLWALLLTPIFFFHYSGVTTPIRLMMLIAVLLHAAAGWAVYRAARELTGKAAAAGKAGGPASVGPAGQRAGVITGNGPERAGPIAGSGRDRAGLDAARLAGLFYLANPLVLYLVVSGMESPVVALLVALACGEYIRWRKGAYSFSDRAPLLRLGLLAGLCMLARTDLVILAGCAFLGLLLMSAAGAQRIPVGARLRRLLLPAVVATVIILPWIAWNLARFGSLVQVSAQAHHLHSISSHAGGEPAGAGRFLAVGGILVRGLLRTVSGRTGLPQLLVLAVLLAVLAVFVFWAVSLLRRPATRRDLLARLWWMDAPVVYAVGFLLATFFVLGHIRSWYVAGPVTVGGVLLSLPAYYAFAAASALPGRSAHPASLRLPARAASALVFAGLSLGLLPLGRVFADEIRGNARATHCWREAADWVIAHTQPDDRVASFNSGTFGYLSPRTVVNLDCVINNRALPYLEQRRLVPFLRENRIRYLIDDPAYVRRYFRAYADSSWKESVVPIDTLRAGLVVYRVKAGLPAGASEPLGSR